MTARPDQGDPSEFFDPQEITGEEESVGVLGVIGPTRLNYARIVPMVDYTARVIGRLIS